MPEGLRRYDLRGSNDDPGEPVTVKRHILVNYAARILTAVLLFVSVRGLYGLGKN